MSFPQCDNREPRGHTITRVDGTKSIFHPVCQRRVDHDGRHQNGSGEWDDDGNCWSYGKPVDQNPKVAPVDCDNFDRCGNTTTTIGDLCHRCEEAATGVV